MPAYGKEQGASDEGILCNNPMALAKRQNLSIKGVPQLSHTEL